MNNTKICINRKNYNLTKDKEYEILREEGNYIYVVNDLNKERKYYSSLFKDPEPKILVEKKIFVNVNDHEIVFKAEKSKKIAAIPFEKANGLEYKSTPNCSTFFVNGMNHFSQNLMIILKSSIAKVKAKFNRPEWENAKIYIDNNKEISLEEIFSIIEGEVMITNAKEVTKKSICHLVAASTLASGAKNVELMDSFWELVADLLNKKHGNYLESKNLMKKVRENPNSSNLVHIYLI